MGNYDSKFSIARCAIDTRVHQNALLWWYFAIEKQLSGNFRGKIYRLRNTACAVSANFRAKMVQKWWRNHSRVLNF